MSTYTCEALYDVAFETAEKAVRQCADNGISYAGDSSLRHDIAKEVAGSWRSMVVDHRSGFAGICDWSSNPEVRLVPGLVDAACVAVAEQFRAMGVTEENQPW